MGGWGMRKVVLLALLFLVISFLVFSEDDYRLHIPDVEEYLVAIPLFDEMGTQDTYLRLALYNTLFWRYPNFQQEINFDLLRNASLVSRDSYSFPVTVFSDGLTQADWNEWLVDAWLRENPQSLNAGDTIQFSNFTVGITRADLSGDGINELLLDIREIQTEFPDGYQTFNYVDYWILQPTLERYHRIASPLRWYSGIRYGGSDGRTGIVHTLKIDDINADGLNEWVVLEGSYFHRGFGECRRMRVLAWQDGSVVDLVDGNFHYCTGSSSMMEEISPNAEYTFTEANISQSHHRFDSWRCFWEETTVFTWTGTHYTYQSTNQNFEDTFNCALRHAEEAMRSSDFENAIVAYERALLLTDTLRERIPEDEQYLDWQRDINEEYRQYARLRLAVAYAMTERWEMALELVAELRSEQPASLLMELLIRALDQIDSSVELCMATHAVFADLREDNNV